MKKLTKIFLIMFMVGIFAFTFKYKVFAAGVSVSPGSITLGIGESGTITVSAADCAGRVDFYSNSGIVSLSSSNYWLDNNSYEISVTAHSYGNDSVVIALSDVTDYSGELICDGYDDEGNPYIIKYYVSVIVPEPVTEAPTEAPEPVTEAPEPVYVEPETEQYYEPETEQYYEPETEQYYAPETEPEVIEVWTEEETESETEESSSETTESTTMETTTKETTSETTTAETIEETAEGDETASDSENGYKAPGGTGIPLLIAVCVVIAGILVFNYLLIWRHKK